MATYRATINTATPATQAFDYLARFSSAVEWDPGVVAGRDLRPGAVEVGSAFELVVRTLGRDATFTYEVMSIDRPHRVVLRAETAMFVSTDTIEVVGDGGSTRVTYDARLDTKGVARLAAPFLPFAFRRIGDRAAEGLQRELDGLAPSPHESSVVEPGDAA